MTAIKDSLFTETQNFVNNHKIICVLTLGVVAVLYALGNLAGRTISWISKCLGTTLKTDLVGRQAIKPDSPINSSPYKIQNERRWGKHKFVYIVEGTDFVLKVPKYPMNFKLYKYEYSAYLISKNLGLDAVPFCALINDKDHVDQEKKLFNNHPGLKQIIKNRFKTPLMLLQERMPKRIPPTYRTMKLDIDNAHKVLFFNMITGRGDSKSDNSMVDEKGQIWEIDNDELYSGCLSVDQHWLRSREDVWGHTISEVLLDHILNSHK